MTRDRRTDDIQCQLHPLAGYAGDAPDPAARMLAAVEAAAAAMHPGAAIAERLATLTRGADPVGTAFGVITPSADGWLVLLCGNVTAEFDAHTLSGHRAVTWVQEILPESVQRVAVSGASRVSGHPHTDLRGGVVPGGGFVLCRVGTTTEPVVTQQMTQPWSPV